MDRRAFLKAGALGAASTLVAASRPARAADLGGKLRGLVDHSVLYAESILHRSAHLSPVDTIVVLMMENRSFDHYFGWLSSDHRYLEAGRSRFGRTFAVNGDNRQHYRDPDTGRMVATYHLTGRPDLNPWRGCGHPDPGHGPVQGRAQRDRGFIARDSGNDVFALGYYLAEDIPLYAELARQFTIFDRYHCSLLSSTYPNRLYLQAAQTAGVMDPPLPTSQLGFDYPAIWDLLLRAGVSCANYAVDLPSASFFGPRALPLVRPIAAFFEDALAGLLPRVVMIDPGFLSGFRTDDHPLADIRASHAFVHNIVSTLQRSPQWHRTALVITYDEWGGFFDHVSPPRLPDTRASHVDLLDFAQAGFRVPTLLISPYARPGFVDHRLYDHTSILRFIEWRFLGAPPEGPGGRGWWLTERDRHANNLGAALLAAAQPERPISAIPQVPLASVPCQGFWFQDVPGLDQPDRHGKLKPLAASSWQQWADAGGPERLGFTVRPSMSLRELTAAG